MTDVAERPAIDFDQISWDTLDIGAVYATYEAWGRPVEQRALLFAPIDPMQRDDWRRRCVADFKTMQGKDCPTCGR